LHATVIPLASAIKVVPLRSVCKRQSNERSDLESGQREAPRPRERTTDPEIKKQMLSMADQYEALAARDLEP
jgi:hypothetical protein